MPASSAAVRSHGIVYRPLADLASDSTIETAIVWRRNDPSPLLQQFLAIVQEVLESSSTFPPQQEVERKA